MRTLDDPALPSTELPQAVSPGDARFVVARPAGTGPLVLPLAPSLERRRLRSYIAMLLIDGGLLAGTFAAISQVWFGTTWEPTTVRLASTLLPLYWTVAFTLQVYSIRGLTDLRFAQRRAVLALLLAMAILLFVAFLAKASANYSRFSSASGLGALAAELVLVRSLARPVLRRWLGPRAENVLVIDDGGEDGQGDPLRVPDTYHIEARRYGLVPDLRDPHMLNRIALFMANMDRVLVTCPPERRMAWSLLFKGATIQGEIIDRQVEALGAIMVRHGAGFGSLVVATGPLGMRARVAKRLFDIAFSATTLLFLTPLLALVALAIKLEDGGPVLFTQQRTGRSNRFFTIWKFRSMQVTRADAAGHRSASPEDERVTRIGRFIRRTSIDELPQLINVLRGEMSVVGPRPHAIGSQAGEKLFWEVDERYWLRHALKPGVTGLAQIRGLRGATIQESDLAGRLAADLEYLSGWSLWRDLRIIAATIRVLVHERAF